jgi:hypothetical protein
MKVVQGTPTHIGIGAISIAFDHQLDAPPPSRSLSASLSGR